MEPESASRSVTDSISLRGEKDTHICAMAFSEAPQVGDTITFNGGGYEQMADYSDKQFRVTGREFYVREYPPSRAHAVLAVLYVKDVTKAKEKKPE